MSDIRGGTWRQVARRAMDAVEQSGVVDDERKKTLHDLADRADRITHDVASGGREIVDAATSALDAATAALRDATTGIERMHRAQMRLIAGVGGTVAGALVALAIVEARRPRR